MKTPGIGVALSDRERLENTPEALGAKAWTLARLERYGFRVPPGLVIPAARLDFFLEDHGLTARAREASDDEALKELRRAITAAPFPEDELEALVKLLADRGVAAPWAVRSSGVGEDGAEASFAGVHDSRLKVSGQEALAVAIKEVWASFWTPRARAYREKVGAPWPPAGAVLINPMLPEGQGAFTAGVAFTCDPQNGRRDVVMIEAVRGLAEALVQGQVRPERWRFDLRGSTAPERLQALDHPVLTAERARVIAEEARRLMWALGDGQEPQDIEWVDDGSALWIVQVRPVTRCAPALIPGEENWPRMWSTANVKDALPGVLRTLSWAAVKTNLDAFLYHSYRLAGYPLPGGLEVARRFQGRLMLDMTQIQWIGYDACGIEPADMNRLMGGHQGRIPVPDHPGSGLTGLRRAGRALKMFWRLRPYQKDFLERCQSLRSSIKARARAGYAALSDQELAEASAALVREILDFGEAFVVSGIELGGVALPGLLKKPLGERAGAVAAGLMAGSGAVTSAEQAFRIEELAEAARSSPAASAILERPEGWRDLDPKDPFRQALDVFLDDFGHRAVYEGEVAHPRWSEDPEFILEQVRRVLENPPARSSRALAAEARARAEAELDALSWPRRSLARWLARLAREGAARRESGKSALAAYVVLIRALVLEAAKRLQARDALAALEDVFDLTLWEIQAALRGQWHRPEGLRALVADRQERDRLWAAESGADLRVLDRFGAPALMPDEPEAPSAMAGAGRADLLGIAAAPGRVEGRARVLAHPSEGGRLRRGDILVAVSTDPGWTPLFGRAAGVAVEVGGAMSHGSIVAREFGLPAVVNVPGLLAALDQEPRIRLDGDRGRITILEDQSAP